MSDALRQMAANRRYEDLQLLQPLRHQQHCQPRRQHKNHSTQKGRFEEGKQLFHGSGYFTRLIDGGARLAACLNWATVPLVEPQQIIPEAKRVKA
jgi:hypothetical protein